MLTQTIAWHRARIRVIPQCEWILLGRREPGLTAVQVHEGPHAFSNAVPLRPGAVITNEPGFYKEGSFGIRIESALVVKTVRVKDLQGSEVEWLAFERFTQVGST